MNNTSQRRSLFYKSTVIALITILVAVPIRTVHAFFNIDYATGNHTHNFFSEWILYGFLLAAFVLLVFVSRNGGEAKFWVNKTVSHTLALLSFGLAAAFLIGLYPAFVDLFITGPSTAADYWSDNSNNRLNSSIFMILEFVTMALSVAAFVIAGRKYLGIHPAKNYVNIFLVMPCVWQACRLVNVFSRYTSVVHIPENLFYILSLIAGALFLLKQGGFLCGIAKNGKNRISRWSSVAVAAVFIYTIPKLIVYIAGSAQARAYMGLPNFIDIAIAVYAVVFHVSVSFDNKQHSRQILAEQENDLRFNVFGRRNV
ncbi:MAG: hypothetical protein FWH14_05665 [Oscillospiraceae bacterium]|nr:hypothetical protein [Oscillospiraceae bacterium]